MTVDYKPISLQEANSLIDGGQVQRIVIRPSQNVDEFFYLLYYEGVKDDALPLALETTHHWSVNGMDVHVFTDSVPTGVPILSDGQNSVGLTSAQFDDLLVRVAQHNASASSLIDVLDQRR